MGLPEQYVTAGISHSLDRSYPAHGLFMGIWAVLGTLADALNRPHLSVCYIQNSRDFGHFFTPRLTGLIEDQSRRMWAFGQHILCHYGQAS